MGSVFECRVQFLDDTDPFNSTSFPEPARPPRFTFDLHTPLTDQLPALHALLHPPHKLDDCTLQLSSNGTYLDLESSLEEQKDELEGFEQSEYGGKAKKHSIILRTELSVRVHSCIEKLYNCNGRELRRALFSLKQIFQDDKDLVHAFVMADGLSCLIKVGAEADQNYQTYILRALGQIMLYVDGMNGVIGHPETIRWLYTLIGTKFRMVVKTALKLLLVFVEYSESNAAILIQAINAVDALRGWRPWSSAMEILKEKDGVDTELLVYTMSLINKTLAAVRDRDSFYDVVDVLEEQGIELMTSKFISHRSTDPELKQQINIYETTLRHEDEDDDGQALSDGCYGNLRSSVGSTKSNSLGRRRSCRHFLGRTGHTSSLSPASPDRVTLQQKGKERQPPLLLSSSYRQHQESLAAERERRKTEREERLQKIEREERNRHSRDYVSNMEEARLAREERFKSAERLGAEEYERERLRPGPDVHVEPPTPVTSPEEESKMDSPTNSEPEEKEENTTEITALKEMQELIEEEEESADEEEDKIVQPTEVEDSGILSDKERHNKEVNEKDICSSVSSSSSTVDREPGEQGPVGEPCGEILNSKLFMLNMLYSQPEEPCEEDDEEPEKEVEVFENQPQEALFAVGLMENSSVEKKQENGTVRAFAERFGDLVKGLSSPPIEIQEYQKPPPLQPVMPHKSECEHIWDQLVATPRELRIGDLDFTDLCDEDDEDVLDSKSLIGSGKLGPQQVPPPPPCPFNMAPPPLPPGPGDMLAPPPPPQMDRPVFQKKKKTIRLFWNEVRPEEWRFMGLRHGHLSMWSKLEPVKVDTGKLELLFENKFKETNATKKAVVEGKRTEIIVLDSKRSNAINIGLTVLPPPRTIKSAILNFDEYALSKEGIEKLLMMVPTEEEKLKIQEAHMMNPDVPLGSAESFLLTLSSISELSARLQLWSFKLEYDALEKEVAEPLQDLKEGMVQLEKNKTFRYILSTLLVMGNFLNGSNAKGFDLSYLEKVPEVKDTLQKQSLLHHVCSAVVENFSESSDLYSEIGAVTRSAKVDFDLLQENLAQMERRCKASWENLKLLAKHEMKPVLKQKMSDFLKDCAERIIILKTVHRRIINRFHAFLLYLGLSASGVYDLCVHRFCKIISEFALEYRTTRERILQQKQKRADHRERNKTRGKMIMDVSATTEDEDREMNQMVESSSCHSAPSGDKSELQGLHHEEDATEHENMKAVLKQSAQGYSKEISGVPGLRPRTRPRPHRARTAWTAVKDEVITDDSADDIMERIVRSATQNPRDRSQARERRRSRANRKSLMCTLKNGSTAAETLTPGPEPSEIQ